MTPPGLPRGLSPPLVAFLVAGAVSFAGSFSWALGGGDETWFLAVMSRLLSGDRLYRDLFFGSLPLSAQLAEPVFRIFGCEILVLRALIVLSFAGSAGFLVKAAGDLGIQRRQLPVFVLALLVFADGGPAHLYSPLSAFFLSATLAVVVAFRRRPRPGLLAAAGLLAGLTFAAKPNVGGAALAAAALSLAAVPPCPAASLRGAALFGAAAALPVVLPLLPFLAPGGGMGDLLEYVALNKGTYLRVAGVPYTESVVRAVRLFLAPPRSGSEFLDVVLAFRSFVLPAALLAFLVAWARRGGAERRSGAVLVLFSLAALSAIFPRADVSHLAYALPVPLLAAVWALPATKRSPVTRRAVIAVGGLLAVIVSAALLRGPVGLLRGTWTFLGLPHVRGVLFPASGAPEVRRQAAELRRAAAGQPLFLLSSDAAFWSLVSGVRNPTPFDCPRSTAFGRTGEARLLLDIESGRLSRVCMAPSPDWRLRPLLLEDAVPLLMRPAGPAGPCTLFVRP